MFELVPAGTHIDFIGKRRICGLFSLALILVSGIAVLTQGLKLGIDFAGGTEVQLQFAGEGAVDEGQVRDVVRSCGIEDASVVRFGEGSREFLVKFGSPAEAAMEAALMPQVLENLAALGAAYRKL